MNEGQSTLNNIATDLPIETPTTATTAAPVLSPALPQRPKPAQHDATSQLMRELNQAQNTIAELQRQIAANQAKSAEEESGQRARSQAKSSSRPVASSAHPQDAVHQHLANLERQKTMEGYPPQVVLIVAALIFVITYLFF